MIQSRRRCESKGSWLSVWKWAWNAQLLHSATRVRLYLPMPPPFRITNEAGNVFPKTVVHDRIHLVAGQPLAGIGSDFADQRTIPVIRFRVRSIVNPP